MQEQKQVQVQATRQGYDGVKVREVGDVFYVDASLFDKRPRFVIENGVKRQDGFYDPPTWIEEVVEVEKIEKTVVPKKTKKGKDDGDDLT